MKSFLSKRTLAQTIYFSFGGYGFWRQYKSMSSEELLTYKICFSLMNGSLYVLPPYNIYAFYKLLNRLEIQSKNLDKHLYENQYTEFLGHNYYSTW